MESNTKPKKSELLPALLKRCMRLIDADIDRTLKQHAMARTQYRALYYVALSGEPSQTELIELMDLQAPTLTLIIDALVRKGWLLRVRDKTDKRVNKLRLTTSGRQKFEHIPDPARKLDQAIKKSLSRNEAQTLDILLNKVIISLS